MPSAASLPEVADDVLVEVAHIVGLAVGVGHADLVDQPVVALQLPEEFVLFVVVFHGALVVGVLLC